MHVLLSSLLAWVDEAGNFPFRLFRRWGPVNRQAGVLRGAGRIVQTRREPTGRATKSGTGGKQTTSEITMVLSFELFEHRY